MSTGYVVNPYQVSGTLDYDQLCKDFGIQKISEDLRQRLEQLAKKRNLPLHHLLRRSIFFAHRNLKEFLDDYDAKKPCAIYTGRAPSGPMHMGHLVPFLFTKYLQDLFDVDVYIQIADEEKFLTKPNVSFEDSRSFLEDNLKDIAAVGFKKSKTFFVIDTQHAASLYPIAIQVAKHINFSTIKSTFGWGNDQNIGAIFYTAMQTSVALLPSVREKKLVRVLIPHAIDQDPHFRLSRDVCQKLGYYKPSSIQCKFMSGLAGKEGKMSSSHESQAILLTDDAATIKKKVQKYAFSGGRDTVEEHRKYGGNPDIDVSYEWLTFLEEDDTVLAKVYDDYKQGLLLSGELKQILIQKVQGHLAKHQAARANAMPSSYLLP
jgi:tryptophanyl-tRNA synthetase